MQLLSTLFCVSTFLLASLSCPLLASKPKPVDIEFTCMGILNPETQNFNPDDVPIIIIHGFTSFKESWHGIFEVLALQTRRKVCIADLRNHGRSPYNDEEYDIEAMAEDIKHLLDRIKAPKAIILGHSLGGKTSIHFALTYPERVEKLIIEDMRPNGITPEALSRIQAYAKILKELEKDIPQGVTEIEARQAFLQLMKDYYAKMNVTFIFEDLSLIAVKCTDGKCELSFNPKMLDIVLKDIDILLKESSGRYDGPTLFIYGAVSSFKIWEDEANIKKFFPNAKLVPVEGADHIVHLSKEFVSEIIKFINSE